MRRNLTLRPRLCPPYRSRRHALRALLLADDPGPRRVRPPRARRGRRRLCRCGAPARQARRAGDDEASSTAARIARPPFAPPFLRAGKLVIGQTANILLYLGGRLGLAPRDEAGRLWAHQLQLTITDLVVLIHDTHHPITGYLYYEEQRAAAKLAHQVFLALSPAQVPALFRARARQERRPLSCSAAG